MDIIGSLTATLKFSFLLPFTLLPDDLGNFTKHDKGVGVHGSHTAKSLALSVRGANERHLGSNHNLSLFTGFDVSWAFQFGVTSLLSHLPADLLETAWSLGSSHVNSRGETSLPLVVSLLFIACVFMLHIWGKYNRA